MKLKRIASLCTLTIILFAQIVVFAELSDITYADDTSGASFKVPIGWEEQPLTQSHADNQVKAMFTYNSNEYAELLYLSSDLWDSYSDKEKKQYKDRINILSYTMLSQTDYALAMGVNTSDILDEEYNGYHYFVSEIEFTDSSSGVDIPIINKQFYTIVNGYLQIFELRWIKGTTPPHSDIIELLNSANLGPLPDLAEAAMLNNDISLPDVPETTDAGLVFMRMTIIFLLTIVIYMIPIILYRCFISHGAIDYKKAGLITVLYAIIAFVFVLYIDKFLSYFSMASIGVVFGSFINYCILCGGYKKQFLTKEEFIFLHTCPNCGHVFKIKYKKEKSKSMPTLLTICPKCNSKSYFKYDEKKSTNDIA